MHVFIPNFVTKTYLAYVFPECWLKLIMILIRDAPDWILILPDTDIAGYRFCWMFCQCKSQILVWDIWWRMDTGYPARLSIQHSNIDSK
jgi:hypothetical protein